MAIQEEGAASSGQAAGGPRTMNLSEKGALHPGASGPMALPAAPAAWLAPPPEVARDPFAAPPPALSFGLPPAAQPPRFPTAPATAPDTATPPAPSDCRAALRALGAGFTDLPPIREGACGIDAPLRLTRIAPGVTMHGGAVMACPTALALARWTTTFLAPAAALWPERGGLTGMRSGSTYACRQRIGDGSGKLSEHATGAAIDIAAFTFARGPDLPVAARPGNDMASAFQATARASACMVFTTVLGPGSDGAHENHLHLDVKPRRGGYRICQ